VVKPAFNPIVHISSLKYKVAIRIFIIKLFKVLVSLYVTLVVAESQIAIAVSVVNAYKHSLAIFIVGVHGCSQRETFIVKTVVRTIPAMLKQIVKGSRGSFIKTNEKDLRTTHATDLFVIDLAIQSLTTRSSHTLQEGT